MKWSINEFCEALDHEFNGIDPLVDLYGVRLDESWGLKQFCGMQTLKSVDFLVRHKASYLFLEFSDIGRQIDKVFKEIEVIKGSNLDKTFKRSQSKKIKKAVGREAKDKYLATCQIFSHTDGCLDDSPALSKGCKFVVVFAPIENHLPNGRKIEIMKFIQNMENNLKSMIPDDMFHGVKIVPLEVFLNL